MWKWTSSGLWKRRMWCPGCWGEGEVHSDFSLQQFLMASSFSISYSGNTMRLGLEPWLQLSGICKRLGNFPRPGSKAVPITSAPWMPDFDSLLRCQTPKLIAWHKLGVINSPKLDKSIRNVRCFYVAHWIIFTIPLLWHITPGSHIILEYLYLFYNLIVHL